MNTKQGPWWGVEMLKNWRPKTCYWSSIVPFLSRIGGLNTSPLFTMHGYPKCPDFWFFFLVLTVTLGAQTILFSWSIKEKRMIKTMWFARFADFPFMFHVYRMAESVGEILNGIRSYFDKSLPVILLYKKERQQYHDTVSDNVSPSSVYGAEHLLRLFGMHALRFQSW